MNFRAVTLILLALILPLGLSLWSSPLISWSALQSDPLTQQIFWDLRLPRYVLAFLVGGSLAIAGASFQSLLKNPLADPYILGVSGGAALGYVLAVIAGLPFVLYPVFGFITALLTLFLIYRLALTNGVLITLNLLLTGIVLNSFSFALILMLNAIASTHQAQQILFLLLGSVESLAWSKLLILTVCVAPATLILIWRANAMNLLSLGEEEAFHMGVNLKKEKTLIFVITSILVGASVSLCGLIGFVGLFVPHFLRLLFKADHRVLLPVCFFGGGLFLTLAEFLASELFKWETLQTKLPVGVITALIGAPLFFVLLKRNSKA